MQRLVATTYLEMTDRAQLRPARSASVDFRLIRVEIPCPELNRFLYTTVGFRWWWYSRLSWSTLNGLPISTVPSSRPGLPTFQEHHPATLNSSAKTETTLRSPTSV